MLTPSRAGGSPPQAPGARPRRLPIAGRAALPAFQVSSRGPGAPDLRALSTRPWPITGGEGVRAARGAELWARGLRDVSKYLLRILPHLTAFALENALFGVLLTKPHAVSEHQQLPQILAVAQATPRRRGRRPGPQEHIPAVRGDTSALPALRGRGRAWLHLPSVYASFPSTRVPCPAEPGRPLPPKRDTHEAGRQGPAAGARAVCPGPATYSAPQVLSCEMQLSSKRAWAFYPTTWRFGNYDC